jgi:hypothetical protein
MPRSAPHCRDSVLYTYVGQPSRPGSQCLHRRTRPPAQSQAIAQCRCVFRGVSQGLRDCLVRLEKAAYRQDQAGRTVDLLQLIATALSPAARGQIWWRSEREDAMEMLGVGLIRNRNNAYRGSDGTIAFAGESHALPVRIVKLFTR